MKTLRVCTALRDKVFEDEILQLITKMGHQCSTVTIDDVINGARSEDLLFIVEDSYRSILDLIEFHNSCNENFLPVVFVFDPKSQHRGWINNVRYSFKYFPIENKLLPLMFKRIVNVLDTLRINRMNDAISDHQAIFLKLFADQRYTFQQALDEVLKMMLSFLFAERGSIMLLNDKGNLTIEASSRRELVGLEVPYDPSSAAWSVIETKVPLFVEDITKDKRFEKKVQNYSKDYFMIVPVFLKGQIHGVLNLSDKSVALLFDQTDLRRANSFLRMLESIFNLYYMDKKYRVLKTEQDKIVNLRDASIHMLIHDIKLPLSSIKGNLEILRLSTPEAHDTGHFIDTAIASCEDISLMVNTILDIYKMRLGKLSAHKVKTDISFLISELTSSFVNYAKLMDVDIETVEHPPVEFETDPSLFTRVIGNLVTNALKNMDSGRKGLIRISLEQEPGLVRVFVEDNGVGISEDRLSTIFDLHYTSIRDGNSHGLGLAFVKSAAEILGGTVTVDSVPGKTRFALEFREEH